MKGSPTRQSILDVFRYGMKADRQSDLSEYPAEFLHERTISPMNKRPFPTSGHTAKVDGGLEYLHQENRTRQPQAQQPREGQLMK